MRNGAIIIKKLLNIKSLRLKIIVYFSILITAALVTEGVVSYVKSSEMIQDGIIRVNEQIIKKTIANIDFYLRDADNLSKVITVDKRIQQAMKSKFNKNKFESDIVINDIGEVLRSFTNTRMDIIRVMVVNQIGYILDQQLVNSSDDLKQASWFRRYAESTYNLKFIGVHDSLYEWNGIKILTCARRVFDLSNPSQQIGYILIDMDYSILNMIFSGLELSNNGGLYLYDDDDTLVYSNGAEYVSEDVHKNFSLMNQDAGDFVVDIKGSKYVVMYAKSSYSSWKLVGAIPYRQLMKNVLFQRDTSILVIVICLMISIIISSIIVSSTYRPLKKLMDAMKKVESGDLRVQVNLNTGDEIEHLSNGFNQMAKELQRLINKVYLEENMKKEAEIYALQAQINPHFLYNTLNSIRFLAKKHDVLDIRNITNSLISLCRSSLESGRKFVSLKQELELVEHYMNIQKLRYGDVCIYKLYAEPDLYSYSVPRFSIQPLVENALFHGIMSAGGGTITVCIKEQNDSIIIVVSDDGSGMDEDVYSGIIANINAPYTDMFQNKGFNSIGIKNISDRTKLYFGEKYGLSITTSKGIGTSVELKIPKINIQEDTEHGIKEGINS